MTKFYLVAASAALCMASYAAPVSLSQIQGDWRNVVNSEKSLGMRPIKTWSFSNTRSADEPQTTFVATGAEFYYMGDLMGNGTGVYQLFLANMPMDKGMPTSTGQMARIEIVGAATDDANPQLCTGTFDVLAELGDEFPEAGVVVGEDSEVLDCFPHPEDPSAGLVAYGFVPVSGSLTIDKVGDEYSISFNFTGELRDSETDELIMSQECAATYQGACDYVDINAYTPFDGDINLPKLNASGRYSDGGDYTISFYTDGMLDEEGFIVNPGYLFNAELFVEDVSPMNIDDLLTTFTPNDVMTNGPKPGTFGEGVWYDLLGGGGWYAALLTSLTEYGENGSEGRVALCVDGTIVGSKVDNGMKLLFDLTSAEGHKVTGSYEGNLAEYVSDFSANAAVKGVSSDFIKPVYGANGRIVAPEGAVAYTMSGMQTGMTNLTSGIYLVRVEGRSFKVVVK